MSDKTQVENHAPDRYGIYPMPATTKLLSTTSLDTIEQADKSTQTKFMRKFRKPEKSNQGKKIVAKSVTPKPSTETDWSRLESSITADTTRPVHPSAVEKKDWHEIPVARMTPQLQKDLFLIENRSHLDPKRFYKSSGTGRKKGELPSRVHVGTVVVGAHEFYSSRMVKRDRRKTFTDEVMADGRVQTFTKNRFRKLQADSQVRKRVIDPAARKARRQSARW